MMPTQDTTQVRSRSKAIRRWATGIAVGALLVAGGAVAGAYALGPIAAPTPQQRIDPATAQVERGTLSGTNKSTGTLEYADSHDLNSGIGGVITALPHLGARIRVGRRLFVVDNVPVYLLHGSLPAWRSFQSGMDDGPDVKQLEKNLKALGYFSGAPDKDFTWATSSAIKKWQKATEQSVTGTIDFGRIVFCPTDVRVSEVKAKLGSTTTPGSPVLSIAGLNKQVNVNLKLSDQALAKVGGRVSINLPGGTSTTGTITSVGVPTEVEAQDGQRTIVIPVVVTLDHPDAAKAFQQASVVVDFPSQTRKDVLSVPVEALLAFTSSTFGVEILDADGTTRRVPVTTGLFAGGRVEISGDGLTEGQKVVVPSV